MRNCKRLNPHLRAAKIREVWEFSSLYKRLFLKCLGKVAAKSLKIKNMKTSTQITLFSIPLVLLYRAVSAAAMILNGPPLPLPIFIGKATT